MSFVRRSVMVVAVGLAVSVGGLSAQAGQKPAPPAAASSANGPLKIGFINVGALLKGMPGYAQAESLWTKEADGASAEAAKLRAVFDTAVSQYQQSQAMLTPSNRTAKERQLQTQQDSLQAKLQVLSNKIQGRQNELLAPLQERLKAIIDGVRAEGNFAMILDLGSQASENIISFDKSLDITVKVAQRLAQSN
jgi:outer membrane protein